MEKDIHYFFNNFKKNFIFQNVKNHILKEMISFGKNGGLKGFEQVIFIIKYNMIIKEFQ